jgi:hypothetical protein
MFTAKAGALTQQPARAAFNQTGATDVRKDVTFHAKEIEIGLASDFKRSLVGSFQQLNAQGSVKAFARLSGNALHQRYSVEIQWRLYVGNIMTVLEDDYVCARFHVVPKVGKGCIDYRSAAASVAWAAW